MPPSGLAGNGRVSAPPDLSHAGKNAMLPTKASFEDVGLPPPSEVATTENGSRNGRSTAYGNYASAVGSPIGDYDVMGAGDGNRGREGWAFSPIAASSSSPPVQFPCGFSVEGVGGGYRECWNKSLFFFLSSSFFHRAKYWNLATVTYNLYLFIVYYIYMVLRFTSLHFASLHFLRS